MTADQTRRLLARFLEFNPESRVDTNGSEIIVAAPWGDESLELVVDHADAALIEALNAVQLPTHLRAIYHRESRGLEVIWGPVLPTSGFEHRQFKFIFEDKSYSCAYSDTSEKLKIIALSASMAAQRSTTHYRNLLNIQFFLRRAARSSATRKGDDYPKLLSFWIHDVDLEEDQLISLTRHINFYTQYFDSASPQIAIDEDIEPDSLTRIRYPFKEFPVEIHARGIDPNLLVIWDSAQSTPDPFLAFLHNYQIIEYSAFYYVQDKIAHQVTRILRAPESVGRARKAAAEIIDLMSGQRIKDDQKIVEVVKRCVDPKPLWQMINANKQYFSNAVTFDGGFELQPLIKSSWGVDDFLTAWMPRFPDTLRQIRNVLVHARETRSDYTLSPSRANYRRVEPWLDPIAFTARQVMLHSPVD